MATLKTKIKRAIAWGRPDNESIGMTRDELIALLKEALDRIEKLESIRRTPQKRLT